MNGDAIGEQPAKGERPPTDENLSPSIDDFRTLQKSDNAQESKPLNDAGFMEMPNIWDKQTSTDRADADPTQKTLETLEQETNALESKILQFESTQIIEPHIYKLLALNKQFPQQFPLALPGGTTLVCTDTRNSAMQLTPEQYQERNRKQNDLRVKEVKLGIQWSINEKMPTPGEIRTNLNDWLEKNGKNIRQATCELTWAKDNPLSVAQYGSAIHPQGVGRFNREGEFLGIIKSNEPLPAGEHSLPIRSISSDFEVRERVLATGETKYEIATVTKAHTTGAGGKELKLGETHSNKTYGANELVAVQLKGQPLTLVKASEMHSLHKKLESGARENTNGRSPGRVFNQIESPNMFRRSYR